MQQIRNQAVAVKAYAEQTKDVELEILAAEIKLRAERRAGELLQDMAESGERKTQQTARSSNAALLDLKGLGVTRMQSHRWQQVAAVDESEFEEYISAKKGKGQAVSADEVGRLRLVVMLENVAGATFLFWVKFPTQRPGEHVAVSRAARRGW